MHSPFASAMINAPISLCQKAFSLLSCFMLISYVKTLGAWEFENFGDQLVCGGIKSGAKIGNSKIEVTHIAFSVNVPTTLNLIKVP